ncbi:Peptidoglycan-binding (PGRP) domain of peptidoglycan hydrolases-containing protein [Candidatus Methanophagaceae archaeon]|nr:Peptidoglycan-binding (PGRP) domain of peptidoglycan hydrolases-containing protein [Methanophagales archaeon]
MGDEIYIKIKRDGCMPSAEIIATELCTMPATGRTSFFPVLLCTHSNLYAQRVVAQAKLEIGQIGDIYEQEADRMADAVMRMPVPVSLCPKEQLLHDRKLPNQGLEVASGLEARINHLRGSGLPLPEPVRAFFEPRFGYDFSQVRIHTDAQAAELARALNARAFTVGQDVVFGAGQYALGTTEGMRLLAHELTHVVQQTDAGIVDGHRHRLIQRTIGDGHDLRSPRFAGDPVLEACYDNQRILRNRKKEGKPLLKGPAVQKIQEALIDAGFPLPKYGADSKFGDETEIAVKRFQRSCGLTGKQVDGKIGPITVGLFDKRLGGLPKEWSKRLKEGLTKLHAANVAFAHDITGRTWKYDNRYWERLPDQAYVSYKPKGIRPYEAVEKLFQNLDRWEFDCMMFSEIAWLYAYQYTLTEAKFNAKFHNLILRQHETEGIRGVEQNSEFLDPPFFNSIWDDAPEGSKVMWSNRSLAVKKTFWENEAAIKSFKGENRKDDRYDAHPLGKNLSEEQVKRALAEHARGDFPRAGSEAEKKSYVRKKIYRHKMYILMHP